ncbi:hypothetical protein D9M71_822870 [compost metagenome]
MPLVSVAIANVQRLKVKAIKHPSDVWMVVDANHHLALAATHEIGHPLVVLERKIHPIASGLPIRRVHVVKGMSAVVTFGALEPR